MTKTLNSLGRRASQRVKQGALVGALGFCMAWTPMALAQDLADSDEPTAATMAFDLAIVRPVSLTATVAGCGLFVLALPLNLIQWSSPKKNADALCVGPGKYTFVRPLGEQ